MSRRSKQGATYTQSNSTCCLKVISIRLYRNIFCYLTHMVLSRQELAPETDKAFPSATATSNLSLQQDGTKYLAYIKMSTSIENYTCNLKNNSVIFHFA